jgi:hypothetical protein
LPSPAGSCTPQTDWDSLVLLPAAAGQVTPHHRLHRNRLQALDQHRAATHLLDLVAGHDRLGRLAGQVVRHDVPQLVEPEQRHLGQDFSLAGDGLTHDHVEGRQPVAGDHQQPVAADGVVVAHLAACKQGQAVKAGFEQGRSHGAVDGREQMATL